jgi:hypothetical protein
LTDIAKRSVIDRHKHDVSAGAVDMSAVAECAKRVFANLAKSDQAEDERGHCCPDQQFPAGLLTLLRPAQAHRASNPSAFVGSVCRTKVIKSETVTRLTDGIPGRRLPLSYCC